MLKKTIVNTTLWAGFEQYAIQGIQFISSIIMARLMMPEAYGIMAMIYVFIDLSLMFVDMGFTTALIRKQNCTASDYATVFFSNLCIGLLIYILFTVSAPIIADFYGQTLLRRVIPAIGLVFIINSLYTVSSVRLTKNLRFDTKAKISAISSILSAVAGIIFAWLGWEVWALVVQTLIFSFLRCILNIIAAKWRPVWSYSWTSFKELFGFGSKVLGGNILFVFYQNVFNVLIGRFMPARTLGFFSRADGYSKLVPLNINTVLMKVTLPLISKEQDNESMLVNMNQKAVMIISFLIFPASMILAGAAKPLVSVLITDKWLPCVPLIQILCCAVMFEHIAWINWDFVLVKGRSLLVLINRLIAFVMAVTLVLATVGLSIEWVAISKGVCTLITVVVSIVLIRKVLPVNVYALVRHLCPMAIVSVFIGGILYYTFEKVDSSWLNLLIALPTAIVAYLGAAMLFFRPTLKLFIELLKNGFSKS